MGAFSQRMLRTLIIPLILSICESFPYVRKGSVELVAMDESKNNIGDRDTADFQAAFKFYIENNMQNSHTRKDYIDQFRHLDNFATHEKSNVINTRTNDLLQTVFNLESIHKRDVSSFPSTGDSLFSSIKDNLTKDSVKNKHNNLEKVYKEVIETIAHNDKRIETNLQEHFIPSVVIENTDNKTKRRKSALPSPERRQRRSGFGPNLEDLFADDETDGIYGAHTSPCGYSYRDYCMNGGTCLYLPSLQVKTCRCSTGYTGTRCDSLNQEYLLALFAEEIVG